MFRFKQFTVKDNRCAMKIGTDGILLGCWADVSGARHILDIGTGCGVIALQCAQKNSFARITGLEIDSDACIDAIENIYNSPWQNRIICLHTSLQAFASVNNEVFDAILSNPPFFENSQKALTKNRMNARHTDTLHYLDIFEFSLNHLSNNGSVQLILPSENAATCVEKAQEYGLKPIRICHVFPTPQKAAHRWLLHFMKTTSDIHCEMNDLVIENGITRHEYTEQYKILCKDFYLHF
jgi:tRNA1Val (adenine37-N6)-methyltransferase